MRLAKIISIVLLLILLVSSSSSVYCLAHSSIENDGRGDTVQEQIKTGDYAAALAATEVELAQAGDAAMRLDLLVKIGWLNQRSGKTSAARSAYEDAMEIAEKYQPQSALFVTALSGLGAILYSQNDLERARPLLERALKLAETIMPADTELVDSLTNYAGLLDAVGEPDHAADSYRKAIAIAGRAAVPNKLQLSILYNGLACNLSDRGQTEEAIALFEKTLSLQIADQGENSLAVADTLNNLGVLAMDVRAMQKARAYLQRALQIYEKQAGELHTTTSGIYLNLGDLAVLEGDRQLSARMYLRSARGVDNYFTKVLPGLSLAERQAELSARSGPQLSRLLSFCFSGDEAVSVAAYDIFNKWKGALIASMVNISSGSAISKEKLLQLQELRQKLAAWYFQVGNVSLAKWREINDELTSKKEKLERELGAATRNDTNDIVGASNTRGAALLLAADEILIDVYRYEALDGCMQRVDRYGAIVVKSAVAPRLVDLGEATIIDSLYTNWINAIVSPCSGDVDNAWEQLSSKLQPLLTSIDDHHQNLIVCPDGELSRLPWQLLTDASSCRIVQINAPREIAVMKRIDRPLSDAKRLLSVGGIDFDAIVSATETAVTPIKLDPLPGTLVEANMVVELARQQSFSTTELTGKDATKQRLLSLLPTMTDVHIATHGFFFDQSTMLAVRNAVDSLVGDGNRQSAAAKKLSVERGISINSRAPEFVGVARNPLVESGIALAGANHCSNDDSERSGFLTAEEIVGTDLTGCKLVALSACDTGRGEKITGQGVLGLRASLISAGVRTVVMSLWKVPDLQTTELMHIFYTNLWQKKMCPADALRKAQSVMSEKYPTMPCAWAGWAIVGAGW